MLLLMLLLLLLQTQLAAARWGLLGPTAFVWCGCIAVADWRGGPAQRADLDAVVVEMLEGIGIAQRKQACLEGPLQLQQGGCSNQPVSQ